MVVQPIVDIRSGTIHAFEALARFGQPREDASPLHWFSLAEELGQRAALERACLRAALELHARRPPGTQRVGQPVRAGAARSAHDARCSKPPATAGRTTSRG